MRRIAGLVVLAAAGWGQTTQGVIAGRITDSVTGLPVAGASVTCLRADTGWRSTLHSDAHGDYAAVSLSPGRYTVIVDAPKYQSQQGRATCRWQGGWIWNFACGRFPIFGRAAKREAG
jgi:protocatechuate 3,4-dioxygenase beta subunit